MTDINKSIALLLNRTLTTEEIIGLNNFKNLYEIDETDPLAIVLALVGANTVLMNSMPDLLQQKASETMELHRMTLRDQSTLIAKELILTLSSNIAEASKVAGTNASHMTLVAWFAGGSFFGVLLGLLISHWLRT